ncbi:MAG: hypothetical protein QOF29_2026 [bacterium]
MFERFTDDARAVVVAAQAEARALGHGWIGTEHLLLGMLADPEARAARPLARWEVDAGWARGEVERRLAGGKPDLDADAPAAVGIDLDEVRDRVERTFGRRALARRRRGRGMVRATVPFTPRARKVLELACTSLNGPWHAVPSSGSAPSSSARNGACGTRRPSCCRARTSAPSRRRAVSS